GAEALDRLPQLRLVVAELVALAGIMLVDHFLDRDGAGHGGALSQQCGARPEREAGDVPQRRQDRWPDAAFGHQPVKGLEVRALLLRHVAKHRATGGPPEDSQLTRIDPGRPEFARLVDADHLLEPLPGRRVAGQPALAGSPRWIALDRIDVVFGRHGLDFP